MGEGSGDRLPVTERTSHGAERCSAKKYSRDSEPVLGGGQGKPHVGRGHGRTGSSAASEATVLAA